METHNKIMNSHNESKSRSVNLTAEFQSNRDSYNIDPKQSQVDSKNFKPANHTADFHSKIYDPSSDEEQRHNLSNEKINTSKDPQTTADKSAPLE